MVHLAGPVWLVTGQNKGRFPRCHGILIRDRDTVLIDPGTGPRPLKQIIEESPPDLVLLTHTHLDHCAQAHLFPRADILVPRPGLETAGDLDLLAERFVGPEVRELWLRDLREGTSFQNFKPSGAFDPWQEIRVGRALIRVIPAPGHTRDHCLFHLPQWDLLVSADMDLTKFGPWYGNPESDLKQTRESIKKARELKPRLVASSHRPPVTRDLDQAFDRYGAVLDERNDRLLDLLRTERDWPELLASRFVYGRSGGLDSRLQDYFERQMLTQHLDELMEQGRVARSPRGYQAI